MSTMALALTNESLGDAAVEAEGEVAGGAAGVGTSGGCGLGGGSSAGVGASGGPVWTCETGGASKGRAGWSAGAAATSPGCPSRAATRSSRSRSR